MRTRVKICGLTREQDVDAAVEAGADAIGLVFYDASPRYVELPTASRLADDVPPFVTVVGLFVNAAAADIEHALNTVRIDLLQFHGDEPATFCEQFRRPYIKALRVAAETDIADLTSQYASAKGVLLDSYRAGIPGGTGEAFDWEQIPQDLSRPIILAGGLTPDNVASAIRQVRPYAVDVSGGVEQTKGIKDANKIRAFINEVQGVARS